METNIPINFVTSPGVSITKACFGTGTYDYNSAIQCVSNLISIGFRKLHLSAYWDASRSTWSLCPSLISNSTSTNGSYGLVQTGGYSCSSNLTFPVVLDVVKGYIANSSTNVGANLVYLNLDLYSLTDLFPSQSPVNNNTIGSIVSRNSPSMLYTPIMLNQQRQDLSSSWLTTAPQPIGGTADAFYLAVSRNGQNKQVSNGGWPNEGIEFKQRLIVSLGNVDSRLKYDASDFDTVFRTSDLDNTDTGKGIS